uniref:Uncharacterized protein n=1 Tax=Glossina palpalis gambiensis TaxID=67801 RepID=A0A1B0BZH7_9MUSC
MLLDYIWSLLEHLFFYLAVYSSNHQNIFGGNWQLAQKISTIWQQYLTIESEDQYNLAAVFDN